jgi:RimJ/RimL family protein N-acetyltransferase
MTPLSSTHLGSWQRLLHEEPVRRHLLDGILVDRAWLEAELAGSDARFADGGVGIFLMWLRAGGDLAGFVGMRPFGQPPRLELMLAIDPKLQLQGLAKEAAARLIEHAFALGHDAIFASCDEANTASQRLFLRLGFTHEATNGGLQQFRLAR